MRSLKKGFTLVELSLSLAFIGILSITIVLIINNAITTYRRGLTLNQINTVGMDLVDDMRATIQNSPANSMKEKCASLTSQGYVVAGGNEPFFLSCLYQKAAGFDLTSYSDYLDFWYENYCKNNYKYSTYKRYYSTFNYLKKDIV